MRTAGGARTLNSVRMWEQTARSDQEEALEDLREAILASFEADGGIPEWLVPPSLEMTSSTVYCVMVGP
jgi:hypothetical protein